MSRSAQIDTDHKVVVSVRCTRWTLHHATKRSAGLVDVQTEANTHVGMSLSRSITLAIGNESYGTSDGSKWSLLYTLTLSFSLYSGKPLVQRVTSGIQVLKVLMKQT
jgi:hypothetical protein